VKCDFGNTVACLPQFWNWLENRRGKNERREKRGRRKETRRERVEERERKEKEEKAKKREDNRSKEGGLGMGNLEQEGKSSKV